jgi:transcriptional regulator with XRE-family HTH domain
LTQAQLAERVGVSTHHVGMIELSRNYPTLELVERIAVALEIEPHELFIDQSQASNDFERLRLEMRGDVRKLLEEFIQPLKGNAQN